MVDQLADHRGQDSEGDQDHGEDDLEAGEHGDLVPEH